jgi:hypothetical protein
MFDTDSECVAWNLSSKDTLDEICTFISSISGAFTFVWYDEDAQATFFIRNEERPLFKAELGGAVYLSSERGILLAALDRRGVKFKLSDIKEVPTGVLHIVEAGTDGALSTSTQEVQLKKKYVAPAWQDTYRDTSTRQSYYPTVVRNALELELGLLAGSWHTAVVTEVVTYSGRNFGNVTCRMVDKEYGCTVYTYNQDLSDGYSIGDVVEVQLQSLDMSLHGNSHARDNKDLSLRASLVRKIQATPHVCECCSGVFMAEEGYVLAQGGEFVCKLCYNSDETVKLYVDSNKA